MCGTIYFGEGWLWESDCMECEWCGENVSGPQAMSRYTLYVCCVCVCWINHTVLSNDCTHLGLFHVFLDEWTMNGHTFFVHKFRHAWIGFSWVQPWTWQDGWLSYIYLFIYVCKISIQTLLKGSGFLRDVWFC